MKLKLNSLCCILVIPLFIIAVFITESETVTAAPSTAQCRELRWLGINACKPVIFGARPSSECCYRIRVTPIECVCESITPERAVLIRNIPNAFQIVRNCGRKIPRHYKCGSLTTP